LGAPFHLERAYNRYRRYGDEALRRAEVAQRVDRVVTVQDDVTAASDVSKRLTPAFARMRLCPHETISALLLFLLGVVAFGAIAGIGFALTRGWRLYDRIAPNHQLSPRTAAPLPLRSRRRSRQRPRRCQRPATIERELETDRLVARRRCMPRAWIVHAACIPRAWLFTPLASTCGIAYSGAIRLPGRPMARILITSALPYINGVKHLGNLVGSQLPSDVYARYMRARGHEVLFICATDEHGTPAELAAAMAGEPVAEYCATE
jgi:hypothetical protein